MVNDQTSVPTTSVFLAQHTIALVERNASGTVHLVPSGQATRYEFACEIVKTIGSRSRVEPASTASFPSAAQRPVYWVLDNRRACSVLGTALPGWKDLVDHLRREASQL